MVSLVNLWHHLAGAAWIPWAVLAMDRATSRRTPRAVALCSLVLGAQVLAGSADMCAITGLLLLLRLAGRPTPERRREWVAFAACWALALLLTAAAWLPALEVARGAERWRLPASTRTAWSVHPVGTAEIVLPVRLDDLRLDATERKALFDGRAPFLRSLHLGLATLGLVVAGAGGRGRRWLLAALAVSCLVALGRHAPAYDLLVAVVPPLRILRYPVKALALAALAWAMLAGRGLDSWPTSRRASIGLAALPAAVVGLVTLALATLPSGHPEVLGGRWVVSSLLTLPPVLFALAGWAVPAVAAACALAQLGVMHVDLNLSAPSALVDVRPATLQAIPAGARVYAWDYQSRVEGRPSLHAVPTSAFTRVPPGEAAPVLGALAMQTLLHAPTGARWARRGSYDLDMFGLQSPELREAGARLRLLEGTPGLLYLLRLGAVDYVTTLHGEGLEDLPLVAVVPGPLPWPVQVRRVPGSLPRAYAVSGVVVEDPRAPWKALFNESLDASRSVVLDRGEPRTADPGFAGEVRIVSERSDRLVLEARLTSPGHVVLVDAHAPGWRARVDGTPAEVLRANRVFRAVAVPAGLHRLELVYRPSGVLWGAGLSAVGLVALLAAALRRPRLPAS